MEGLLAVTVNNSEKPTITTSSHVSRHKARLILKAAVLEESKGLTGVKHCSGGLLEVRDISLLRTSHLLEENIPSLGSRVIVITEGYERCAARDITLL